MPKTKAYKAKGKTNDIIFFEDRIGDFNNFDLAPNSPKYDPDQEDFIPLKPKKGARKKKFHNSEEEMEIAKDYMENCDSFDDIITPVASNFNYDEDQSDIYSGDSNEESDFQAEVGILEQLMKSSGSESNDEDLIDCLDDDFKDFQFKEEEEYIRQDFEGKNDWNTTKEEYNARLKEGVFKRRQQGIFNHQDFLFDNFNHLNGKKIKKNEYKKRNRIDKENESLLELSSLVSEESETENIGEFMTLSRTQRRKERKKELKKARIKKEKRKHQVKEASNIHTASALKFVKNVNAKIMKFVQENNTDLIFLDPMDKELRQVIVQMCKYYKVKPKLQGKGDKKSLIIFRTGSSFIPFEYQKLPDVLMKNIKSVKGFVRDNNVVNRIKETKPAVGSVVGGEARELGSSNLGHQMMLKMGWGVGESLGATSTGILEPVSVVIRGKRTGLGG